MKKIVFLGGGRITSALMAGLRLAGYKQPIVVHDRNPAKLRQLRRRYRVKAEAELDRALAGADLLVIAVRPQSVSELLKRIAPVRRDLIAVSLAAGIPLARLRNQLGAPVRWARAMPSPACRTGCGLTALTFEKQFPSAGRRVVKNFFAQVGPVIEIPESKFDAFTVTYSCSHGYHALEALAEAAVKLGLDNKSAFIAAAHALADGILSWRKTRAPLKNLLHEAATPGGIAAAVMNAMNAAGYQGVVERGLRAGLARTRANANL
ncbi:MAG TPA: NAD(P)-binding domain-containing protein [Terriglobales bacterium]|nr:NAD(P)-binding domain-containing protein [Terriglobales bacterium]